jgi:putative transposase
MADITYVPTDEGGLYLATLEDLAPRQIVGGACDHRMTQALTWTALDRAVARHRPPVGVLHHSDRGSQYAAAADPARRARYGMTARRSRKGHGGDHAGIASWYRRITNELVYLHHFRTRAEARLAIFADIAMGYHRQRLHRALGYRTPQQESTRGKSIFKVPPSRIRLG